MLFKDIQPFTRGANYHVHVPWTSLEKHLKDWQESLGLDLEPDFQRIHVWTEPQQRRYRVSWKTMKNKLR
jgi:hypothetical protein